MSTMNPDGPSNEDLLLTALRGFVDEYDDDRGTWPDDMVMLLDNAHWTLAEVTGLPRRDYPGARRVALLQDYPTEQR